MRSVDEQLARALAAAVRPAPVRVAISEAQGLLCAEEVVAERALPGFDQAAVDGYAVRSVDVRSAGVEPVSLPVVGEIPAGSRQPRRLQPGQAVRVDTGAPLPTLADAVVPLGYTDEHPARVTINQPVPSAAYVRRTGEDVQIGDVAVRRGDTIGSAQVGLLAAVGRAKVLVYPRPRVSIVSVGDELVDIDRTPSVGQVYDVNSYALAAAARDAGAEGRRVVFEVLVRPLIRAARGTRNPHRRIVGARLLSPITSTEGRRGFLRGQLLRDEANGEYLVQPLGQSGAHLLASLAEANCLINVPEDLTDVPAGEQVQVTFLAQRA